MNKFVSIIGGILLVLLPSTAWATPGSDHKLTICHRTSSVTNPYVKITVDLASVDGNTGNDHGKGDHYAEHQGPVWNSTMTNKDTWGDIIPPNKFNSGLNWNSDGIAIYNNGCKPVEESTPTPTPSETPTVTSTVTPTVTPTNTPTHRRTWTPKPRQTVPTVVDAGLAYSPTSHGRSLTGYVGLGIMVLLLAAGIASLFRKTGKHSI